MVLAQNKLPIGSITMVLIMVISHLTAGPAADYLVFDRLAVADGQLWRLVTAHFIHSDSSHLLWNAAGLLVLGGLFESRLKRLFPIVLALGILSVAIYLLYVPTLNYYCGLSGVLNTLLAAGLVQMILKNDNRTLAVLTLLGATAKIAVELTVGDALFTSTAWQAVPLAHLFGFVGGLFVYFILREEKVMKKQIACLLLAIMAVGSGQAGNLSSGSDLSVQGSARILEGTSQVVAGSTQMVIESVKWTGESVVLVLRSAPHMASVTLEASVKGAGQASLAVGESVTVIAQSTGHLITKAGEVIAFIPSELGASLIHQSKRP